MIWWLRVASATLQLLIRVCGVCDVNVGKGQEEGGRRRKKKKKEEESRRDGEYCIQVVQVPHPSTDASTPA